MVPFADGGEASAANIQLRCRAHNAHEALKQSGGFLVREVPPPWRVANSVRTELREGVWPEADDRATERTPSTTNAEPAHSVPANPS